MGVVKLRYRFLSVVAVALCCDYMLLTIVVPIIPSFFDGYTATEIAVLFASKSFFQFFANPIFGSIVDKHGPRKPLLIGVIVLTLSTFAFAIGMSQNDHKSIAYALCLIARSVQGVASASTMSAGMSLIASTHEEETRGTAIGLAMAGVALGTLTGPPIGGIMAYYVNYWSPFVMVGSVLALNATLQTFVLYREDQRLTLVDLETPFVDTKTVRSDAPGLENGSTKNDDDPDDISIQTLLDNKHIAFICLASVIVNGFVAVCEALIPLYLHNEFNKSVLMQGLLFLFATGSYALFTPITGIICDNPALPKWLPLGLGLLFLGLGFLCFSISITLVSTCVGLFFTGIGVSFVDTPNIDLLTDIVKSIRPNAVGKVYALNDMSLCVGFTVGPILGAGLQAAFGGGGKGFRNATCLLGVLCIAFSPSAYFVLRDVESQYAADKFDGNGDDKSYIPPEESHIGNKVKSVEIKLEALVKKDCLEDLISS